jgi:hypothetical protein
MTMALIMRGNQKFFIGPQSSLADMLLAYGYASQEQIDKALNIQQNISSVEGVAQPSGEEPRLLSEILISMGYTTSERVKEAANNLAYYQRYELAEAARKLAYDQRAEAARKLVMSSSTS